MTKTSAKCVFGTLEWADRNENIISGCVHDCLYCYSKEMAIRYKRKTAFTWKNEIVNEIKLQKKASFKQGKIMFPSSHDITPDHLNTTLKHLEKLLELGNDLLIVSKPHLKCIKKLCENLDSYKKQILFRFTVGSKNSEVLRFWEPGAPDFDEREEALKYAQKKGFRTSVSIEPMLDTVDNTLVLVRRVLPYVTDAIWIGTPNFLRRRLKMNGQLNKETEKCIGQFAIWHTDDEIRRLYKSLKSEPKVKWKESIKKIVGITVPTSKGLDV